MNYVQYSLYILTILLVFTGSLLLLRKRSPTDVLKDLRKGDSEQKNKQKEKKFPNLIQQSAKELTFLHILSAEDLRKEEKRANCKIFIGCLSGLLFFILFFTFKITLLIVFLIAGTCLGYIVSQASLRSREKEFKRQIIFFLPVVMERIVMAVQSGLDVVPAIKVIDQIERSANQNPDAVTLVLRKIVRLCESGLSFEAAVDELSSLINVHALKHTLIHLAVAHKEGGEIIYPLRELSDATQQYFQENIEEEIAKLPIKATLPLLMTFAGLIVTFMTGPVIQIINVSSNPSYISNKKTD